MFRITRVDGAVLAAVLAIAGCSGPADAPDFARKALPSGYAKSASSEHLPLVDHPEFANWSRFPVGTYVVRKKEVTNDFGVVRVTTKMQLRKKSAEEVVVDSQVTVDRPGEPLVENPPQAIPFSAKFPLPAAMKVEQFLLPSLKAKALGEETVAAGGREFRAQVFGWDERNETGPMAVKLWRSDDVPGRMIRQQIEGHQHHSVEDLVEIVVPEKS